MSEWIPFNGTELTETELALRSSPEKNVMILKKYAYKDERMREYPLTSELFSTSSGVSHAVAIYLSSQIRCGCVQFFFISTFLDIQTVFAYIDWYGEPEQDYESRLFFMCSKSHDTSLNPIVPAKQIISSLVIAQDETFADKIWILNYSF